MTHEVLVVGDVMTDIIVRPDGPLVRGSDRSAAIRPMPGGSGANQAAWLGHLGVPVAFAARVGAADAAAQAALLRAHGVAPHLAEDADTPTGMLVTLLDADGERSFFTDRGANARLRAADLPESLLAGARWLHLSGYSLFTEAPRAAVLALAGAARRQTIPVSVDAGSAGFLREVGPAWFVDWTQGTTLFANADEAEILTGETDADRQLAALAGRYRAVILKRGASGAVAARGGLVARAPAVAAEVLDTTGAGDAFLAGFLRAALGGADLAGCLADAVALGAHATSILGGRPPQP